MAITKKRATGLQPYCELLLQKVCFIVFFSTLERSSSKADCYIRSFPHSSPLFSPVVIEPQSYDPNYYKQSFVFENGFVICKFDRKLALSVNQFGRACLAKLDVTDPSQQWHVNSQGNLYPGSKVSYFTTRQCPFWSLPHLGARFRLRTRSLLNAQGGC